MHVDYAIVRRGTAAFRIEVSVHGRRRPVAFRMPGPADSRRKIDPPPGEWSASPKPLRWTYDVDLSPAIRTSQPPWYALAGRRRGFVPGRTILALPCTSTASCHVEFPGGVPEGSLRVGRGEDLPWLGIAWGDWRLREIGPDAPGWMLATTRRSDQKAAAVAEILPRVLRPLVEWLGRLPSRPLIWFEMEDPSIRSAPCGLALSNGVMTTWPASNPGDPRFPWLLAHELAHAWVGLRIRLLPELDWLREGAASWLAFEACVRAGFLARRKADELIAAGASGGAQPNGVARCAALHRDLLQRGYPSGLPGALRRARSLGRRPLNAERWAAAVRPV